MPQMHICSQKRMKIFSFTHTQSAIQHQTTLDVENVNDLQVACSLSLSMYFFIYVAAFMLQLKKFFLSLCDKKFTFCFSMAL